MFAATGIQRPIELAQELLLFTCEIDRRLHHDSAQEIAFRRRTHRSHPLATQSKQPSALGFRRDLELDAPVERRDLQFAAENGRHKADRYVTVQVGAVTHEYRVIQNIDMHVEIARRPAVFTRLPFPGKPDAITGIHPRRDLDGDGPGIPYTPLSVAGITGFLDDPAVAPALGARLLYGKHPLLHADLAAAAAGRTAYRRTALFRTRTVTFIAGDQLRHTDLYGGASHRIFELQIEIIPEVRPAKNALAARRTPPGNTPEDVAENRIEDIAKPAGPEAAGSETAGARACVNARLAKLVIGSPFPVIGKNIIGLLDFLELVRGTGIILVAIGMILHGQAAIGFLYLRFSRVARDAEGFIIISLRHPVCRLPQLLVTGYSVLFINCPEKHLPRCRLIPQGENVRSGKALSHR